jgi:hypothetical protein
MKRKSILLLVFGFIFLHVGYISCCHCDDSKLYYKLNSFSIRARDTAFKTIDNSTPIATDSIYLEVLPVGECIAFNKNPFAAFANAAYACKCSAGCDLGLKNKLTSIKISSNDIYNGIAPNLNLNQFFKAFRYNNIAIDSMKSIINNKTYTSFDFSVVTGTKPNNTQPFKLKIEFTFDNGIVIQNTTKDIVWQ